MTSATRAPSSCACRPPPSRYPGCDFAGPFQRALQAKMSIQFGVAATLQRRAIAEENYQRPRRRRHPAPHLAHAPGGGRGPHPALPGRARAPRCGSAWPTARWSWSGWMTWCRPPAPRSAPASALPPPPCSGPRARRRDRGVCRWPGGGGRRRPCGRAVRDLERRRCGQAAPRPEASREERAMTAQMVENFLQALAAGLQVGRDLRPDVRRPGPDLRRHARDQLRPGRLHDARHVCRLLLLRRVRRAGRARVDGRPLCRRAARRPGAVLRRLRRAQDADRPGQRHARAGRGRGPFRPADPDARNLAHHPERGPDRLRLHPGVGAHAAVVAAPGRSARCGAT